VHRGVQNNIPTILEAVVGDAAAQAYVPAGDLVYRAGELPRIALIRAGVVRVFIRTEAGRQSTVEYARPGDVIGLAAVLGGIRAWNAEAVVHTTLAVLTLEQVQAAAALEPELPWLIAVHVATRASAAVLTLAENTAQPMAARVARHLLEVALPAPDGHVVAQISHQRLADAVGTVREVMSRQLRTLRTEGVIDTQPGRVIIVNEKLLEGIAARPSHWR
jgi:CRP/FNR family transcriptional regulator, cyclic AMP receptor protein